MSCLACAARQLARDPDTVFGSSETLVERGIDKTADVTGGFAEDVARAVRGKTSAKEINAAINAVAKRFPRGKVSSLVRRELLQGSMLGALDADWEAENDTAIEPEAFRVRVPERLLVKVDAGFVNRELEDAIRAFLQRKSVTRETFDAMDKAAQRKAFTVAKATSEGMVETVKRELARQVSKGADLADFGKHAAARLEAAGWTPENPSHLETVFRTNVLGSYGGGRAHQMTQEQVLEMRPFWQVLGIRDGRQRKTHEQLFGVVLAATDPFWIEAYPPFGYRCRCRCRSLSIAQGAPRVQEGKSFLRYVPDPGFASGLAEVMAA